MLPLRYGTGSVLMHTHCAWSRTVDGHLFLLPGSVCVPNWGHIQAKGERDRFANHTPFLTVSLSLSFSLSLLASTTQTVVSEFAYFRHPLISWVELMGGSYRVVGSVREACKRVEMRCAKGGFVVLSFNYKFLFEYMIPRTYSWLSFNRIFFYVMTTMTNLLHFHLLVYYYYLLCFFFCWSQLLLFCFISFLCCVL